MSECFFFFYELTFSVLQFFVLIIIYDLVILNVLNAKQTGVFWFKLFLHNA